MNDTLLSFSHLLQLSKLFIIPITLPLIVLQNYLKKLKLKMF